MAQAHGLNKCVVTGWRVEKKDRVPGQPCPHCGTTLPTAGETTPVDDSAAESRKVLTVTTDEVPGYRIVKTLGLVRTSQGHDIRKEKIATREAMRAAQARVLDAGGNAIVGFRIAATDSLIHVYGTGVVIEPLDTDDVE